MPMIDTARLPLTMSARLGLVALALAGTLVLSACSGGGDGYTQRATHSWRSDEDSRGRISAFHNSRPAHRSGGRRGGGGRGGGGRGGGGGGGGGGGRG